MLIALLAVPVLLVVLFRVLLGLLFGRRPRRFNRFGSRWGGYGSGLGVGDYGSRWGGNGLGYGSRYGRRRGLFGPGLLSLLALVALDRFFDGNRR